MKCRFDWLVLVVLVAALAACGDDAPAGDNNGNNGVTTDTAYDAEMGSAPTDMGADLADPDTGGDVDDAGEDIGGDDMAADGGHDAGSDAGVDLGGDMDGMDGDGGMAVCGNGVIEDGEECDDGNANSDTTPNACRTTCEDPSCGDGVIDDNEQCDDGDANSGTMPDACRPSCSESYCGDGVIDTGEDCDDGDFIDTNDCPNSCDLPSGIHRWSVAPQLPSGETEATATAFDASGNQYVLGTFTGRMVVGTVVLESTGKRDVFLLKYDASGTPLWGKAFLGDMTPFPTDIAVDSAGDVVIGGHLYGAFDFGGGTPSSADAGSMFLAKYDDSGTYQWDVAFGSFLSTFGTDASELTSLAIDSQDDIVVTGHVGYDTDFGGGTVTRSGNGNNAYVAKFDSSGQYAWATLFGGSNTDGAFGEGIAVASNDDIVVTGAFEGALDIGSNQFTDPSAGSAFNAGEVFLARFDSTGSHVWSDAYGSTYRDRGVAITVDNNDDIVFTGTHEGDVDFGGGALTGSGMFLVKVSGTATHTWSQDFGGGSSGDDTAWAVETDASNAIFIGGGLENGADFGGGYQSPFSGEEAGFVAKFKADGSYEWDDIFGVKDDELERITDIAIASNGDVGAIGWAEVSADPAGISLQARGRRDALVARYETTGSLAHGDLIGSPGDRRADRVVGVNVNSTGNAVGAARLSTSFEFGPFTTWSSGGVDLALVEVRSDGSLKSLVHVPADGPGSEILAESTALDTSDNVIVTGRANGPVELGGGTSVAHAGEYDIFLAKYDSSLSHVWSKSFGSSVSEIATTVATDGSDNIFVGGRLNDPVDFGGGSVSGRLFLASFDAAGNHRWSKAFGPNQNNRIEEIAVDSNGRVVVVGSFVTEVDIGGTMTAVGGRDLFLAVFDNSGSLVWSDGYGSNDDDEARAVAVDSNGNIVFTGTHAGMLDLGGGAFAGASYQDVFVAKFDSSGNHLWSKAFTGPAQPESVAVDSAGEIVIGGMIDDQVDFGGGPLVASYSSASVIEDSFIAKFDGSGTHIWSKTYGSTSFDESVVSVATDASGGVVASGVFAGDVDFGGGSFSPTRREFYLLSLSP